MERKEGEVCIGIDLGTTYSCVAVWENGRVEIIPNSEGNRTTPSFVAFTATERLIGDSAKNQAAINPTNTVFDAKRLIGRGFRDSTVHADMKHWPFRVVEVDLKPVIEVEFKGQVKRFKPEEISAMVLVKMKETAEAYLGHPVSSAVVTVPAYFNDQQRQATKDAGAIAGLSVKRIINEPTAAAIAYGLEKNSKSNDADASADDKKDEDEEEEEGKNVLIFDLGGGTFDVSLLTIEEGIFEVKATAGDTHLGGEDIDNLLVDYMFGIIKQKMGVDIRKNARAVRRLRTSCERAKRALSSATSASVEIDSLVDGEDFFTTLTRAKLEELCANLFRSTLKPVEQVLKDSGVAKKDVDEVVLVGGSTRIPKIQSIVSAFFGGKELCKSINPDEAVAHGAAVQGAILSGRGGEATQSLLLLDVTPLSLGIEVMGGRMSVIVRRNTPIPHLATEPFTTVSDNQTEIEINVYEGERPMIRDCHLLGTFMLRNIPPMPRGEAKIKVSFELNSDGMLVVTAKDKASGGSAKTVIENNAGRLSKEEIDRMMSEAQDYAAEDARARTAAEAKVTLEETISQVRSSMGKATNLSPVSRSELEDHLAEVQQWLTANPEAAGSEIQARITELRAKVEPILQAAQVGDAGSFGGGGGGGGGGVSMGDGGAKISIEDVD